MVRAGAFKFELVEAETKLPFKVALMRRCCKYVELFGSFCLYLWDAGETNKILRLTCFEAGIRGD